MHRSRAGVRVFSDDGRCVADGRVMRRALEYVEPSAASSPSTARTPPRRPAGLLPRGRALRPAGPARLAAGRRGEHHRPRRHARRAHRLAGPRRPRQHGRGPRRRPLGQGARHPDDGEVTPHHLALAPTCSPATTRSTRSTRRCAPTRTARPSSTGCSTAPSTRSPPTTRPTRGTTRSTPSSTRPSGCSASRPPSPSSRPARRRRPARLGRPRAGHVDRSRPDRRPRRARPAGRRPASPPTSCSSTPPPRSPSTATPRSPSPQHPLARPHPHRRRPHDDPARHRHRARRGAHRMLTTREPAVLVLEDGRTFTGRAYGRRRRDRRRGRSSPPA